jgi:threonine dehydrogenase-like Zn-dependent dehydrogenase
MTVAFKPSNQTKTMQAAVVAAPRKIEICEVPRPEPGPQQVRVRIEGCGVCCSNIPPWEGRDWFKYPFEPGQLGHEAWGTVDRIGEDVRGIAVSDRVALLSQHAYAEYDVADVGSVVVLPNNLSSSPFPAEPLGCAMNIFRRSHIRPGMTVAIVGIGFLGAVLTRLAEQAGARVIAISRRADSLAMADAMGAHELIPLDDHWKVINRVAELTSGSGGYDVKGFCDVVIECTGKQWPLDLSGELCAVRGRLVIAGYHQDGLRQVNLQLWNWRGLDVINAHERDPEVYLKGMLDAVDAVSSGRLDPTALYTHRFSLDQLADALNATVERPPGFMKALVMM